MIRTSAHADICAHSKWAPYHRYSVAQDNTFQICWGVKSKVCEWAESHRRIQSVVGWIGGRSMPCTRAWTPWYDPFSIGFFKLNLIPLQCNCIVCVIFIFCQTPFLIFLRSYIRAWTRWCDPFYIGFFIFNTWTLWLHCYFYFSIKPFFGIV